MNLSQVHLPAPNSQFAENVNVLPHILSVRSASQDVGSDSARRSLASTPLVVPNHPFVFCLTLSSTGTVIVHAIPKLCNNKLSEEGADLN
jgi:hypothetical protein